MSTRNINLRFKLINLLNVELFSFEEILEYPFAIRFLVKKNIIPYIIIIHIRMAHLLSLKFVFTHFG